MTEVQNPWSIESIYDFQYFICPKCSYQNHSKQEFVNHAFEIHPEAVDHLCKIQDDSLNDIFCPWIIPGNPSQTATFDLTLILILIVFELYPCTI